MLFTQTLFQMHHIVLAVRELSLASTVSVGVSLISHAVSLIHSFIHLQMPLYYFDWINIERVLQNKCKPILICSRSLGCVCVCNFNKLLFYCSFSDEKPQNTLWYKSSRILAMRHSVQRETMYTNLACAHIEFCHLAYNLYTKETKLYAEFCFGFPALTIQSLFSCKKSDHITHIVNE